MASVSFQGLWVHNAEDLSDYVHLRGLTSARMVTEKVGEVRELANGRLVYRGRSTRRPRYEATVRAETRAQRAKLAGWVGKTVQVRDGLGNRIWGVYHAAGAEELQGIDQRDIALSVEGLTEPVLD